MDAHKTDIYAFITHIPRFIIPVYQRNYDWKIENCRQLFLDIERIAQDARESHFIGTICTKSAVRHQCIIIDGQQRLTSLMLLAKAIYNNTQDKTLRRQANHLLFNEKEDAEARMRLKPIKKDEKIFSKLVNQDEFDEEEFTEQEKLSNVYVNYQFFSEMMKKTENNFEDILDAIERLELIELEIEHENPQVIFESLNSTGLDLTNTDLLRNYLLMALDYDTQEKLYIKYWLEMEEMLGTDNMERFMMYYLIMKKKSNALTKDDKASRINTNNLYYAFKKEYSNISYLRKSTNVEDLLKDMHKYAKIYRDFTMQPRQTKDKTGKRLYELFSQLEEYDTAIFLMPLYEKCKNNEISIDDFNKAVDIIISYTFRSKVCKKYGMTTQVAALSLQRYDTLEHSQKTMEEKIYEILLMNKGSYSFPKDSEFRKELIHADIYKSLRSLGCRYLLGKIERHITKESVDVWDASIEHVIPQTLSNEWKAYLANEEDLPNYELYVHTLGNITLTKYNSELSNDCFAEKKKIYKDSNFIYTKQIADYDKFTSKQIYHRAEKLSNIALNIWALPEKYNKMSGYSVGTVYNLDSDINCFGGMRPDIVGICGEEFKVADWKEFWIKFNEVMYNIDKSLYMKMSQMDDATWAPLTSNVRDYRFNHDLENGIWLNTVIVPYSILNSLSEMINYIDKIKNTNYRDEIWITVRKIPKSDY